MIQTGINVINNHYQIETDLINVINNHYQIETDLIFVLLQITNASALCCFLSLKETNLL